MENAIGIVWASAVCNGAVAVTNRVSDLLREVSELQSSSPQTAAAAARPINSVAASVAVFAAILSMLWVALGSLLSPDVYTDLAIPASSLLLLCTRRGMVGDFPPLALSTMVSANYLLLSALYSIFMLHDTDEFFVAPVSWYEDGIVSFWSAPNWWKPLLALLLTCMALPGIVLAVLRRKDEAEEVMFVLGVLGIATFIGAEIMSTRMLGAISALASFWRVYDISLKQTRSNRLI